MLSKRKKMVLVVATALILVVAIAGILLHERKDIGLKSNVAVTKDAKETKSDVDTKNIAKADSNNSVGNTKTDVPVDKQQEIAKNTSTTTTVATGAASQNSGASTPQSAQSPQSKGTSQTTSQTSNSSGSSGAKQNSSPTSTPAPVIPNRPSGFRTDIMDSVLQKCLNLKQSYNASNGWSANTPSLKIVYDKIQSQVDNEAKTGELPAYNGSVWDMDGIRYWNNGFTQERFATEQDSADGIFNAIKGYDIEMFYSTSYNLANVSIYYDANQHKNIVVLVLSKNTTTPTP